MTRAEAIKVLLDASWAADNEGLADVSECKDALRALGVTEEELNQ